MIKDLILNAALLVMLSVFLRVPVSLRKKNLRLYQLILGLAFGIIAVLGMIMPFEYESGIIFDGRSIIVGLAGLYGGGISAAVAAGVSGAYRIYLGGAGVYAGVATVIVSGTLGGGLRYLYKNRPQSIPKRILWAGGLVIHIAMLACQLLIPQDDSLPIIREIALPILLIFPVVFALIALLLAGEERRMLAEYKTQQAEKFFRTTLYSIGDAVITTDKTGHIMQMNPEAEKLTGYSEKEARGKKITKVFLPINQETGEALRNPISKVISQGQVIGLANHTLLMNKAGQKIPISDSAAPIIDDNKKITGAILVFKDESENRKQNELLKESRLKYRRLVESIEAVVWEYSIHNDRWNYISPSAETILNIPPRQWTNLDFILKQTHPEDREQVKKHFTECPDKCRECSHEFQLKNAAGEYRQMQNFISTGTDNNSGETLLRGFMLDTTERKQAEIELKNKNEFIETVLDEAPIGIALNKIEGGDVFYMNKKFEEIYGWDKNELKNIETFFKKVYPDKAYREKIQAQVMADMQSSNPRKMVWNNIEITKSDDRKAYVNCTNIPLPEQNIMVSTVTDITEQKITEKALRESEEQFRKMFEKHSAVHLLADPDNGKIVNTNQAAVEFYGYSREKLTGMHIGNINTMPAKELQKLINIVKNSQSHFFEAEHKLSDGRVRDVEVFSSPIDLKGKIFLHSIIHDISEKKKLLADILAAKDKAEESDRLKSAFLANISHEIRTPLNGILGFTDLMTHSPKLPEHTREKYARVINKSAENLMRIIDDILDISKLETGQIAIEQAPCNINHLLKDIKTLYVKKLEEKSKTHISLELNIPQKTITAVTDEGRLNQILTNLLDNALKFTDEGKIAFGLKSFNDRKIDFFISDTGIGIAEAEQKFIFDRFAQADQNIARKYGGTGLGLSIVQKLVKLLNGEINLESTPNTGTTFVFSIQCPVKES